ncbi:hypothetical protein [Paenibacillus nasutitermitis]|uniref:Uncharacterized protein n=1 Tax=Paenibacillus nasutitermitis TaxID=1652958 RepID=A0A917DVF4_9BACL|nr:hypothetical protein [Paenibacillus nasutitermitis]GGD70624.1 hypothetical protein GCM10010911_30620 [Paenibacillus nasutitermitis]
MGKSPFSPEYLNELVGVKKDEIASLKSEIEQLEIKLNSKKVEINDAEELQKIIPVWRETYKNASTDKKKVMLGSLLETVMISKDSIEVNFRIILGDFKRGLTSETRDSDISPY